MNRLSSVLAKAEQRTRTTLVHLSDPRPLTPDPFAVPLSTQHELDLLTNWFSSSRRAKTEEEIRSRLAQQSKASDLERDAAQSAATERYEQEKARLTAEYAAARQGVLDRFADTDAAVRERV